MLEKLFYNIGFFYTKIRFFRKKDLVQNFTTLLHVESKILIVMPFKLEEFDEAKTTMLNLRNEWPTLQIYLVVKAEYLVYSELANHFNIFALGTSNINKFFLPKRKFLKPILAHDYDVVIDFNETMNLASSFIAKRVDVNYRISFIKEHVDRFFNVQFNKDSVHSDKNIYSSLMNNLKMFCSEEVPKPKQEVEDNAGDDQKDAEEKKDTNTDAIDETDNIEETKKEENNENKKQSKRGRPKRKSPRKEDGQ